MERRRRILTSALCIVGCLVAVVLGWIVSAAATTGVLLWPALSGPGAGFFKGLAAATLFMMLMILRFGAPVTLLAPLACVLLGGLTGGIVGGRKGHPYRGFVLGVLPGVVLGAALMAVLLRFRVWR